LTFLVKVHLKIHVKVHLKVHFLRVWYFLLPRVPPLLFLREGSPLRLFSAIESRITNKKCKSDFFTFLVKVNLKIKLKIHVKVHLKMHFFRVLYFLLPRVPPLLFLREGFPLRLFSAIESKIINKKCKTDLFDIFGKSAFKNTCKSAFKSALFESLVLFVTK